ADQPAVADRGGRNGLVAWGRARAVARGGGTGPHGGRRRLRRARSRRGGRGGAALRAEPPARRRDRLPLRARLRAERGAAAAAARLSAPARRSRLVRDDEREVAV